MYFWEVSLEYTFQRYLWHVSLKDKPLRDTSENLLFQRYPWELFLEDTFQRYLWDISENVCSQRWYLWKTNLSEINMQTHTTANTHNRNTAANTDTNIRQRTLPQTQTLRLAWLRALWSPHSQIFSKRGAWTWWFANWTILHPPDWTMLARSPWQLFLPNENCCSLPDFGFLGKYYVSRISLHNTSSHPALPFSVSTFFTIQQIKLQTVIVCRHTEIRRTSRT